MNRKISPLALALTSRFSQTQMPTRPAKSVQAAFDAYREALVLC